MIAAALAFGVLTSMTVATGGEQTRTLFQTPGVPIIARLLPDDDIVIVKPDPGVIIDAAEWEHTPTWRELVDYAVAVSHFVGLIRITNVTGEFTEDGSWIRTRMQAQVVRAFKLSAAALRTKQIRIRDDSGGEVHFGRTLIRAGDWPRMETGTTYLFFGEWFEYTPGQIPELFISGATPLQVEQQRLFSPWKDLPGFSSPLNDLSVNQVIREIQRVPK